MNHHLALYRKYRPQTFDDVVGQEHIVSLLTKAIANNTLSHAYLFYGGRGTGKTSVARIFATTLGVHDEDIIEIDAASHRGIDDVRALREAVMTMPFTSTHKVYIIDEAHMLTKEASNALLKTLEEPPAHVIFLLATTDKDKLPQTIISRCQLLTFVSPSKEVLRDHLITIAKKEGKTLSQESAEVLASHGNHSYRDALGKLEQILTITEKTTISHESVMSFFGVVEEESILTLLTALCRKDKAAIMASLIHAQTSSYKSDVVYTALIGCIRRALLSRIGVLDDNSALVQLGKEYPYMISSKTLRTLIREKELLAVSQETSWIACEAILLSLVDESEGVSS